jgi:hypothetical protein
MIQVLSSGVMIHWPSLIRRLHDRSVQEALVVLGHARGDARQRSQRRLVVRRVVNREWIAFLTVSLIDRSIAPLSRFGW